MRTTFETIPVELFHSVLNYLPLYTIVHTLTLVSKKFCADIRGVRDQSGGVSGGYSKIVAHWHSALNGGTTKGELDTVLTLDGIFKIYMRAGASMAREAGFVMNWPHVPFVVDNVKAFPKFGDHPWMLHSNVHIVFTGAREIHADMNIHTAAVGRLHGPIRTLVDTIAVDRMDKRGIYTVPPRALVVAKGGALTGHLAVDGVEMLDIQKHMPITTLSGADLKVVMACCNNLTSIPEMHRKCRRLLIHGSTRLADPSPVIKYVHLTFLSFRLCQNLKPELFAVLGGLSRLEQLDLGRTRCNSAHFASKLKALSKIWLDGTSIKGLEGLGHVLCVNISETSISNLAGLSPRLLCIKANFCPIISLEPVSNAVEIHAQRCMALVNTMVSVTDRTQRLLLQGSPVTGVHGDGLLMVDVRGTAVSGLTLPQARQIMANHLTFTEGEVGDVTAATNIHLRGTNISSIGLRAVSHVQHIICDYCPDIQSLAALEGKLLSSVSFIACSRITDVSPLAGVRSVTISKCRNVRDVNVLAGGATVELIMEDCTGVVSVAKLGGLETLSIAGCDSVCPRSLPNVRPVPRLFATSAQKTQIYKETAHFTITSVETIGDRSDNRGVRVKVMVLNTAGAGYETNVYAYLQWPNAARFFRVASSKPYLPPGLPKDIELSIPGLKFPVGKSFRAFQVAILSNVSAPPDSLLGKTGFSFTY